MAGRIHAKVQRFTLDDATSAYEAMREGTLEGRAVIVPAQAASRRRHGGGGQDG